MCPDGKLQLFHVRRFGVQPRPGPPVPGRSVPAGHAGRVSSLRASQVGHCYSSPALEVSSEHLLQLRQAASAFRPVLLDANTLWKGETVDEATGLFTSLQVFDQICKCAEQISARPTGSRIHLKASWPGLLCFLTSILLPDLLCVCQTLAFEWQMVAMATKMGSVDRCPVLLVVLAAA